MADPVKGRTDAGRRREQRALQTRTRIVDAARRLFLQRGYLATTIEGIATEAGVAVATVYQAFGTKQAVLSRVLDSTIVGDTGADPLLARDWVAQAARRRTPARRLAAVVQGAAQVAAATSALKQVMRDAAAADPQVRELIRQDHERRRRTQRALVELALGQDAALRPGLTLDRAADAFFLLVSSDGYELATGVLGWSQDAWQRWLVATLTHQLLDPRATGTPG